MAEMTRAEVREVLGPPDLSEKIPGRLRDKEALGYWHLYPWDHVLVWILGENFRTKTMGLIVIFEGEEVLKVLYCPPYSSWSRVLVAEEKPRRNYLQPGK
ncbi:MAG: hypothetical protein KGZ25_12540 [Planctomycetes bacterium]|nr:hypothetical protein [Planctomycetota bacterium]